MPTRLYPPAELHAEAGALAMLERELSGVALPAAGGPAYEAWLRTGNGDFLSIRVDARDLEFKFEVFPLAVLTLDALRALHAAWAPVPLPGEVPPRLRTLLSASPPLPEPPARFEPWPFETWGVEVLRSVDYVVAMATDAPAFGDDPLFQSATTPGFVPPDAIAACEVADGLLFTADTGERLLFAADAMPLQLLATRDAAAIDARIAHCERVALADYRARLGAA